MATLQTEQEVGVEDVRRRLSDELGPRYRVTVASDSALKVGRTGTVPSRVKVSHTDGGTSFRVQTTGLVVSRLIQMVSINPHVRRALSEAYTSTAPS